jgi:signal peptidase I
MTQPNKRHDEDKKLVKEIILVLIIKVVVLFVIWHSFFDEPTRIDNPSMVADSLLSPSRNQGEIQ